MKVLPVLLLLLTLLPKQAEAQTSQADSSRIDVYLLTMLPGEEVYSIYGHSAIRIVIPERKYDTVFNWGVFDFNTPNFTFKFVKGRLDYLMAGYPYERLVRDYFIEQRTVISQKINLNKTEKDKLMALVQENLKPENVAYRYDFFYDNCATRIRDIIENSTDNELQFAENKKREKPTLRELLDKYQKPYPWLDLGIDMLLGMPADKKAGASEQMFLPDFLMSNLSEATINHDGITEELLGDPEIVIDFNSDPILSNTFKSPLFVLWALLVVVLTLSLSNINSKWMRRIDIPIFSFFSLLVLLINFTTFFTDHSAMKWNFHVIWLSPLVIISLIHLIIKSKRVIQYRVNMLVTLVFLPLILVLPQQMNRNIIPVILILFVRLFFLSAFGKTKS